VRPQISQAFAKWDTFAYIPSENLLFSWKA